VFSNVFDKLKPNSRVFSTNSLSRYNTTLRLFDIAFASGRLRGEVLCYMFGAQASECAAGLHIWKSICDLFVLLPNGADQSLDSVLINIRPDSSCVRRPL